MWHTLAFFKADTAGATNETITAVQDQIVKQSANGNYILQQDMIVAAAYFRDAGATGARLNTPDFRRVSIPNIHPVQRQAGVTNLPALQVFRTGSIRIPAIDELIFQGSNNGAGGVAAVGGLWVKPLNDNLNIPPGDQYKLRATATTLGVVAGWELVNPVFDEVLPAGNYAIVGFDATQASAVNRVEFARIAWVGGAQLGTGPMWRPGVPVQFTEANQNWQHFQNGNAGLLGSFVSTAPPSVEVFSVTGVAATLVMYFDVIKIG